MLRKDAAVIGTAGVRPQRRVGGTYKAFQRAVNIIV